MNKSHPRFLGYKKKDEIKFRNEFAKLNARARNILISFEMNTWNGFYYHFLITHDAKEFDGMTSSGSLTKNELISFTRSMFNPNGQYSGELQEFEYRKSKLSSTARSALRYIGISLFETFYYRLVIQKEIIDFKHSPRCSGKTGPEVEEFVESFCAFLGVILPRKKDVIYFNPTNPQIPFIIDKKIKNKFISEFSNLSKSTKENLSRIGAEDIEGFYKAFISPQSPFNVILKEFGESTLFELLRFRSVLESHIKTMKRLPGDYKIQYK